MFLVFCSRVCVLTTVRHRIHGGPGSFTQMVHALGQHFSKFLLNRLLGGNVSRLIYNLKGSSVANQIWEMLSLNK